MCGGEVSDSPMFKTNIRRIASLAGSKLQVATACSGSDLWMLVMLLWCSRYLPGVAVDHLWSCDSEELKYEFIRKVWHQPTVFTNVAHLCRSYGEAWGVGMVPVLPSLIFAAGFSCKAISSLNQASRFFDQCCETGAGSTGETYCGILNHVRVHLPLLVVMENVRGISRQAQKIIAHFRDIGYVMVFVSMVAIHRGFPQTRRRGWFMGVLAPAASEAQQLNAQRHATQLEAQLRIHPLPLGDFISDTHSQRIRKWALQQISARDRRRDDELPYKKWKKATPRVPTSPDHTI